MNDKGITMNARALKEWNVSKGDFSRSMDTDYENKFRNATGHKKSWEKKIMIAFSISGLTVFFLVLEYLTRI